MTPSQASADREGMRLAALYSLSLFNDDEKHVLDRFVHLAADVFRVPIAIISFIDADRQIYVARAGIDAQSTPRGESICNTTIAEGRTLLIPDASVDPLWRSKPFVIGAPGVRFYAATPLQYKNQPIGTFCLVDHRPRHTFDEADQKLLESFAFIVSDLLEIHQLRRATEDGLAAKPPPLFAPAA